MSKNIKLQNSKPTQVIEELRPGQSIELLKELHILTREGKLNQDTRRKLKQVYHLYQFIEPLLNAVTAENPRDPLHNSGEAVAVGSGWTARRLLAGNSPAIAKKNNAADRPSPADHRPQGVMQRVPEATLADHGAGKSYLGFILYDLFFNVAHKGEKTSGHIYGIETRAELVEKSRALAQRLGFQRMSFLNLSVQQATTSPDLPEAIDIVTALHACDTATDDAIAFGFAKNAKHMVLVPCCQAEVAGVLKKSRALNLAKTPLAELWRHPLHTREFGSQITNVLRCLQLEANGYNVSVTELVGWEHSMKNELILASRPANPNASKTHAAQVRLKEVLSELGLQELTPRFGSYQISC